MEIQKYQNSNLPSIKEVLVSEKLPLVKIKIADKAKAYTFLDASIIEFCSIYKLDDGKIMNESERMQCSDLILEKYYYLKEDDIRLFITNCKMGLYGKPFGSVDMPFFFQALKTYADDRQGIAETINQVKAIEAKREALSEDTMRMIAEFKAKEELKRRAKYEAKEAKEMSEEQKLINTWIADFKKEVGNLQGFISVEGKKLDIGEYLNYRNEKENL